VTAVGALSRPAEVDTAVHELSSAPLSPRWQYTATPIWRTPDHQL